jgi:hypothetical protein
MRGTHSSQATGEPEGVHETCRRFSALSENHRPASPPLHARAHSLQPHTAQSQENENNSAKARTSDQNSVRVLKAGSAFLALHLHAHYRIDGDGRMGQKNKIQIHTVSGTPRVERLRFTCTGELHERKT